MRIGNGYDVHAFAEDRELVLGGVRVEHDKGLLGHSDADVLVHAIMDAILGALCKRDIGYQFPDTDMQYKDISSIELLKRVKSIMYSEGYELLNIDSIIAAQEPKLSPYIDEMRVNIAGALDTDIGSVSVKATTTERLGFVGRVEGIEAYAVCLLKKK